MLCMQKLPLQMGSLKWDTNICKKKKIIYFQKIPMKIFLVESKKDPTLPEVSLTAVVQSSHTTLSPPITNETQQQPACSLRLCLLSFLCPRQNSLTASCLKIFFLLILLQKVTKTLSYFKQPPTKDILWTSRNKLNGESIIFQRLSSGHNI